MSTDMDEEMEASRDAVICDAVMIGHSLVGEVVITGVNAAGQCVSFAPVTPDVACAIAEDLLKTARKIRNGTACMPEIATPQTEH